MDSANSFGFIFRIVVFLLPSYLQTVASFQKSNDYSSNALSEEEDLPKLKFKAEHNYYLPMQTTFGGLDDVAANGVSVTSPPHLAIHSAPIDTSPFEISLSTNQIGCATHSLYSSQCISETSSSKLQSQFIMPSKIFPKESAPLSGHLEVASKTSDDDVPLRDANTISVAIQGTLSHL